MCFIVHKTTLELEHMILTTLYLAGAKNTDRTLMLTLLSCFAPSLNLSYSISLAYRIHISYIVMLIVNYFIILTCHFIINFRYK
jgi:hypothetical protein